MQFQGPLPSPRRFARPPPPNPAREAVTAIDIHSHKKKTINPRSVIGVASLLPVMQSVFSK